MTEKEKYRQVCREAAATGIALLVLIVFWLFAGFGLSGSAATVFRLPLWAAASTVARDLVKAGGSRITTSKQGPERDFSFR